MTVAQLADRVGVSRSWIYTQPALRDRIRQLQQHRASADYARDTVTRASDDSLRQRLALAHERINQLRTENQQLRDAFTPTANSAQPASAPGPVVKDTYPRREIPGQRQYSTVSATRRCWRTWRAAGCAARTRPKVGLRGPVADQHSLMCTLHLEHIDHLTDMIARLDTRINQASLPFARQTELLATIPGISERASQVIISEVGVDMTRFPTAAHLASWAGLCPGNNESAGKHRSGKTRKGNTELCTILTECAWAAARTSSYVGAQFHRFHRRLGKKGGQKAAAATAHTLRLIQRALLISIGVANRATG